MAKIVLLLSVVTLCLIACLPDVSTETSELEARAILEDEVIRICGNSQSSEALDRILLRLDTASVAPTRDFWRFQIFHSVATGELEALVFPSRIVTGPYVRFLKVRVCK